MEELKAMFRVCVHVKKDGVRCGSPALKGGNFCFQHIGGSLREHTRARSTYNGPQLDFLYPGTRQAIQHNLYVVAQAMNDGKIELALAKTYNRIFSTCEGNLRRWEMQCKKSAPEPELLEVPDESPAETPSKTPAPNRATTAPGTNRNDQSSSAEQDGSQDRVLSSRPESAPSADGAERPAFSDAYTDSALTPANESPEPAHSTLVPDPEPLVLTPEEVEKFNKIETRYIDDPTLADRIRDAYREIREQRRPAECPTSRRDTDVPTRSAPPAS